MCTLPIPTALTSHLVCCSNVWAACVLALVGVVTIASAESAASAASSAAAASIGGLNIGQSQPALKPSRIGAPLCRAHDQMTRLS